MPFRLTPPRHACHTRLEEQYDAMDEYVQPVLPSPRIVWLPQYDIKIEFPQHAPQLDVPYDGVLYFLEMILSPSRSSHIQLAHHSRICDIFAQSSWSQRSGSSQSVKLRRSTSTSSQRLPRYVT